jgi:hypothetical protein
MFHSFTCRFVCFNQLLPSAPAGAEISVATDEVLLAL